MLLPVLLTCALALVGPPASTGPAAPARDVVREVTRTASADPTASATAVDVPLRLGVEPGADGATRVDVTAPGDPAASVRLLADEQPLADLPLHDGRASLTTNAPAQTLTACLVTAAGTGSCVESATGRPGAGAPATGAGGVPVTVTVPSGGLVLSSPAGAVALRPAAGGRATGVTGTVLTDTRTGCTTATVVLAVETDGAWRSTRVVPLRPARLPGNALDPHAFTLARPTVLPTGDGVAAVTRRPASQGTGAVRLAARIEVDPVRQPVGPRPHDAGSSAHRRPASSPRVTVVWTAF